MRIHEAIDLINELGDELDYVIEEEVRGIIINLIKVREEPNEDKEIGVIFISTPPFFMEKL